jgi:cell division protein FtsI/penicillin-binding protein 2
MASPKPKSRAQIIIIGLFVVMAIFVVRLFYIQVIQHDKYAAEADDMQVTKYTIQPERGQIYVHDGDGLAPLVLNETVYTVFADPKEINDVAAVENTVRQVAGGEAINDAFAKLSDKSQRYVVLARQVTRTQAEKIRAAKLAGVGTQTGTRRVYPEGELAAQTLGFVNADGVGQYGIEQFLNDELTGKPGVLQSVTDVRHIPLTIGQHDVRVPATNGAELVLTLDRNIQAQAETTLKSGLDKVSATRGSIVVMNPENGAIMALANFPSYNPAEYGKVQDASLFQSVAVENAFEPGSVMKALTTGASLDSSAINRDSTFYNTGCVQIADARICNVERSVDGRNMNMTQILQYSLNTGVVWQLEQMGGGAINTQAKTTLYNYFTGHYRFGQKTGVEQVGESAGLVFAPDDVEGGVVRYANMTFGQGMNATMLQVASAFAAAVNGGTYYKPHVVDGTRGVNGQLQADAPEVVARDVLKPETSQTLKAMLHDARQAYTGGGADGGYFVGAKSGTAQVYDEKTGKYSETDTIGTYLGFGADSTGTAKYVIMVRVDDSRAGGFAGSVAAGPIFTEMSNWIINYRGVSK